MVFTWRGDVARLISARKATRRERERYEAGLMKAEYDFSGSRRGAPIGASTRKTRITIRIDDDVLAWFRRAAHEQGGASYQTLINAALRGHVEAGEGHLEQTLRRVIREEVPRG